MHAHRLGRLARLTQGVALVGLGLTEGACSKDTPKPDEPHMNAPYTPTAEPSASAMPPPHMNATAPPPKAPVPAGDASAPAPPTPKHVNAPPTTK